MDPVVDLSNKCRMRWLRRLCIGLGYACCEYVHAYFLMRHSWTGNVLIYLNDRVHAVHKMRTDIANYQVRSLLRKRHGFHPV